jgi:hypothetical protein
MKLPLRTLFYERFDSTNTYKKISKMDIFRYICGHEKDSREYENLYDQTIMYNKDSEPKDRFMQIY